MDNILPTEEFQEVEGRLYSNPQVGVDETNTFIDKLRESQGKQNQEIFTDTQMLGTDVPSNLGGLTGANSYFTSRYQTPQTISNIANLRATAQAQALNEVLANEQAKWKKKYQDAYRNYQKRQYNRAYGGGGGIMYPTSGTSTVTGDVEERTTERTGQGRLVLDSEDFAEGGVYLVEPGSGDIIGEGYSGNNPRYKRQADGSYVKVNNSSGNQYNTSSGNLSLQGALQNNAPLANALRSKL